MVLSKVKLSAMQAQQLFYLISVTEDILPRFHLWAHNMQALQNPTQSV